MKSIAEKTYPGNLPRPAPLVTVSSELGLYLICIPWGTHEAAHSTTEMVKDLYSAALTDGEATSPYADLNQLSKEGNQLRSSCLLTNDAILQKYNRGIYKTGCELLAIARHGRQINWIRVGHPHLLLLRNNIIKPLDLAMDLNLDFPNQSPLPQKLLGVEKPLEIETKTLLLQDHDILIFLNRTTIPQTFLSRDYPSGNLDTLKDLLSDSAISESPETPFWIGVVQINS